MSRTMRFISGAVAAVALAVGSAGGVVAANAASVGPVVPEEAPGAPAPAPTTSSGAASTAGCAETYDCGPGCEADLVIGACLTIIDINFPGGLDLECELCACVYFGNWEIHLDFGGCSFGI